MGLIPGAVGPWFRSSAGNPELEGLCVEAMGQGALSRGRPGCSLESSQDIEGPETRQHDGPDRHPPGAAGSGKGVYAEDPRQEVSPVEPMGCRQRGGEPG
jgi:hypothetical protein